MPSVKTSLVDDLTRQIDAARQAQPGLSREEVAEIVEEVVKSLGGAFSLAEINLYREIDTLAKVIQAAKREIVAVRPDEISDRHIPEAAIELDAVVEATAKATGEILDYAEALEKLGATLPAKARTQITETVTGIFEACNFQDITGQRITKVVKTLNYIETKIGSLLKAFGEELGDLPPLPEEEEEAPVGDAALLNGPQLPQNANSQSEIDAILAGLF
ncbi:MAG TPA: protein phosphatase CheZ [Stellaceae bacterium]|jgi:chemotaxis protein CheZ|nr:protein phosphatase CheZ [Stellaceae bacterium]